MALLSFDSFDLPQLGLEGVLQERFVRVQQSQTRSIYIHIHFSQLTHSSFTSGCGEDVLALPRARGVSQRSILSVARGLEGFHFLSGTLGNLAAVNPLPNAKETFCAERKAPFLFIELDL